MASVAPEVIQWIRQMASAEQAVSFYAFQSLREHVFRAGAPGQDEQRQALIAALGGALTAQAKTQAGRQPASFAGNPFLNAAAAQSPSFEHPPAVRSNLARLLGLLPDPEVVPHLAKALEDLHAREMARCSLEMNPSPQAEAALAATLGAAGTEFRIGVLNSLGKRKARGALPRIREAAADPLPEVRIAALYALAGAGGVEEDALLERATRAEDLSERRAAHICRLRLAAALAARGERAAALKICRAIAASSAPQPQKMAAESLLAQLSPAV